MEVQVVQIILPDGRYSGSWSGYRITLAELHGVVLKVDTGIRGINEECVVEVTDGNIAIRET